MNEGRYIHELNAALGPLEFQEREGILQDYRQHFRDGRAEGLTDDAIAAALGAPQAAAAAYLEGWGPHTAPPPRSRARTILLAAAATLAVVGLVVGLGVAVYTEGGFGVTEGWIEATSVVMESPPAPRAPEAPSAPHLIDLHSRWGSIQVREEGVLIDTPWGRVAVDSSGEADLSGLLGGLAGRRAIGAGELKLLEYDESFRGITSITVEGDYQLGCTVRHSGDDAVKVELSGRIPQMHDVDVSAVDGRLVITYEDNGHAVSMNTHYYPSVTVYLPGGIELDSLSIETMNGPVRYDPYGAAGQTHIHQLLVDTMSGNITLSAGKSDLFRFDDLLLETMSGTITASYIGGFRSATLNTMSGSIEAQLEGAGEIEVGTVSGAISLAAQPGSIQADSVSGDITLRLANRGEPNAVSVYCESLSGSIDNQLGDGGESSAIRCETVSGDITVTGWPQGSALSRRD